MKVAVLGAGFQGVCVALELAKQGIACDLYDQGGVPVTQAGLINEGKIHLGYVYGKDPTLNTARKLMKGALTFHAYLNRWMKCNPGTVKISEQFQYLVHANSILQPQQIEAYFKDLEELYKEVSQETGLSYLGLNNDTFYERQTDLDGYSDKTCFLSDHRAVCRSS